MSALDREQPWLEVREETSSSSESGLDCGPIEKKEDLCAKEEELPLPGAARRESGNSRQFDLGAPTFVPEKKRGKKRKCTHFMAAPSFFSCLRQLSSTACPTIFP